MRERVASMILILSFTGFLLTGCGHEHVWSEATCENPKTCTSCGETEGEPLGHDWIEATCEEPKTCATCGKTEGEPLEHEWMQATFKAPKTCINCGETEGGILGLTELTVESDTYNKIIKSDAYVCTLNEGFVRAHTDANHNLVYEYLDRSGNVTHNFSDDTLGYGITSYMGISYNDYFFSLYVDWSGNEDDYIYVYEKVYDAGANLIGEAKTGVNTMNALHSVGMKLLPDNSYVVLYDLQGNIWSVFDYEAGEFVDSSDIRLDTGVSEKYDSCSYQSVADCYFVKTDGKWGFADKQGNILSLYTDATGFIEAGYALISDDKVHYDLCDTNMEVVAEDVIVSDNISSVYTLFSNDYFFVCIDGKYHMYTVGMIDAVHDNKDNLDQNIESIGDVLDINSIEITPNDTEIVGAIADSWNVYAPGTELTSLSENSFDICYYDQEFNPIASATISPGNSLMLGEISGEKVYFYDILYDFESVSAWKVGCSDSNGVIISIIAVDGPISNPE